MDFGTLRKKSAFLQPATSTKITSPTNACARKRPQTWTKSGSGVRCLFRLDAIYWDRRNSVTQTTKHRKRLFLHLRESQGWRVQVIALLVKLWTSLHLLSLFSLCSAPRISANSDRVLTRIAATLCTRTTYAAFSFDLLSFLCRNSIFGINGSVRLRVADAGQCTMNWLSYWIRRPFCVTPDVQGPWKCKISVPDCGASDFHRDNFLVLARRQLVWDEWTSHALFAQEIQTLPSCAAFGRKEPFTPFVVLGWQIQAGILFYLLRQNFDTSEFQWCATWFWHQWISMVSWLGRERRNWISPRAGTHLTWFALRKFVRVCNASEARI